MNDADVTAALKRTLTAMGRTPWGDHEPDAGGKIFADYTAEWGDLAMKQASIVISLVPPEAAKQVMVISLGMAILSGMQAALDAPEWAMAHLNRATPAEEPDCWHVNAHKIISIMPIDLVADRPPEE